MDEYIHTYMYIIGMCINQRDFFTFAAIFLYILIYFCVKSLFVITYKFIVLNYLCIKSPVINKYNFLSTPFDSNTLYYLSLKYEYTYISSDLSCLVADSGSFTNGKQ